MLTAPASSPRFALPILQGRVPTRTNSAPAPRATPTAGAAPSAAVAVQTAISDALDGAVRSYQALPTFLYPSVTGSAAEKSLIFATLDRLPMKDVGAIPAIRVVDNFNFLSHGNGTILGVTVGSGDMAVARTGVDGLPNSDDLMRYIVMHESGHAHDFQGGLLHALFMRTSNHGPWGHGPFPTEYAQASPAEDFAEGHAFYHLRPEELQRVSGDVGARTFDLKSFNADKWKSMDASEQPNAFESLVAQKPFRDTGRLLGELTSNHIGAGLHTAFGFMATIGVIETTTQGFTDLVGAHNAADALKGGLSLAAGLSLIFGAGHPVLGPAALALLGARRGLDQAEKAAAAGGGRKAAAAVGGALGGMIGGVAGPLGGTLAGYSIGGPVGGVIGLVAGSLVGFRGGSAVGAKAALAITR